MPEFVCECKTLMVSMVCDKCEDGVMEFTGNTIGVYLEHQCGNCGTYSYHKQIYPYTRCVPIEPLRKPTYDEDVD